MNYAIEEDLGEIWDRIGKSLLAISVKTLLLTGSTGSFGIWLLNLISYVKTFGIEAKKIYIVSRNPSNFISNNREVCGNLPIFWIQGDIRNFEFPRDEVDICIHGATTSAKETFLGVSNLEKYSTVVNGTQRILKCVEKLNVKRFLYLSSGAVFGGNLDPQRRNLEEVYVPIVDHLNSVYTLGHAKRCAETLCFLAREQNPGSVINIARLFTFIGPHIPLDLHYAIGNFLSSAKARLPIRLTSNGLAIRSFMYMSDATAWIVKSLFLDENEAYALHIGSEKEFSILEVAHLIESRYGSEVILSGALSATASPAPNYYVPSTKRTRQLLELEEWTTLENSINKTLRWIV